MKLVGAYISLAMDCLLNGLKENLREAQCYMHTRHNLLVRLYLPLILVNVYHKESGVGCFTFGGDELCSVVWETGDREYGHAFISCGHTFDSPNNFSFDGNCVKILDYGEEGFENLLIRYGDRIEKLLRLKAKEST
jgi:hypothetical protein